LERAKRYDHAFCYWISVEALAAIFLINKIALSAGGLDKMKDQVAEIVAAYLRNNHVAANDIPTVISQVYQSLAALGKSEPAPAIELRKPAVPIRRSVNDDFIVCLDCGFKASILRRHLLTAHKLTPEEYRQRWDLSADYPIVAPNYAARRSELAKTLGLGKRNSRQKAAKGKSAAT
jgi:predicted transcriptional regulator